MDIECGWAITRSVRNAPDEGTYTGGAGRYKGWYETSIALIEAKIIEENAAFMAGDYAAGTESINMSQGKWDTEPDAFSYNVGGYTGKFYLKPGQTDVTMVSASSDVKIICQFNTTNKSFDYWTLIAPDGVKYTFGQPNKNEFTGEDLAVDLTYK